MTCQIRQSRFQRFRASIVKLTNDVLPLLVQRTFTTRVSKGPTSLLLRGGGGVILEKNNLQVHMRKKKIPAQDNRPKNN